jgi:hypothetical protein
MTDLLSMKMKYKRKYSYGFFSFFPYYITVIN